MTERVLTLPMGFGWAERRVVHGPQGPPCSSAPEDVEEQIGVFRAEELARAALAEANYKVFLAKLKDMDKPHSDDHSEDLTMGVIDNSKRASSDITMTNNLTKVVMDNDLESDVAESSKGGGSPTKTITLFPMRILFWNVRGLGKTYRRN